MFINYVNGIVSINTFRKPNATATTIADIMAAVDNLSTMDLVASVSADELENPEINKFIGYYAASTVDLPIEL